MTIVRFRKEDHKELLKVVRKMKEELSDIEDCLNNVTEETEYRKHYDNNDDDRNYRGRYGYRHDRYDD